MAIGRSEVRCLRCYVDVMGETLNLLSSGRFAALQALLGGKSDYGQQEANEALTIFSMLTLKFNKRNQRK